MPGYYDLKGLPVVAGGKGERIGTVRDLIIDETSLRVEWIRLDDNQIIGGRERWLAARDISQIDDAAVVAADGARLTDRSPLPANHLVASEEEVIGKRVISANGEELGKVVDYSFAVNGMKLATLSMEVEGERELLPEHFSLDLNMYQVKIDDVSITAADRQGQR